MCLAAGLAFLPLRMSFYEAFLALHIVLVVLMLVGCWYHLVPHFGFDFGYEVWLYIAFAFWAADRLARLARLAFYNHLFSSEAVVEAIPDTNILQITVFPRTTLGFGPGQHSFLYFVGLGKFWESHPFSVAGWKDGTQTSAGRPVVYPLSSPAPQSQDNDREEKQRTYGMATTSYDADHRAHFNPARPSLRFLTRVHSGATATLQRRLSSHSSFLSSDDSPNLKISVYNEGPYGGHQAALQPLYNADTVLCLVGGIGITNALGYIQEYSTLRKRQRQTDGDGSPCSASRGITMRAKRFILAWTAREMALIRHVEHEFLQQVEGVEHAFWCTGSDSTEKTIGASQDAHGGRTGNLAAVTAGRMDLKVVIRSVVEKGHHTAVMLCGPGEMADAATTEVIDCVKDGYALQLHVEAFAW